MVAHWRSGKHFIVLNFCHLIFGFVSDFEIRISNFALNLFIIKRPFQILV